MKKPEGLIRMTALVLVFMMSIGGCFTTAFAEDSTVQQTEAAEIVTEENTAEIIAVEAPDDSILYQEITAYSGAVPVLPETVPVQLAGSESFVAAAVSWTPAKEYNNKIAGTYKYTGSFGEAYTLAGGASLPQITVKVVKCQTKINGRENTLTKKSRSTLYDKVTVYNGYGSKLKLQMYNAGTGKWITKKTITLKNTGKQAVSVKYSNDWWKVTASKWRLKIEPSKGTTGVTTKTTTVKTKRYYQNPSKYVQIKDKIKIDNSGAYTLKYGYMG